jgi:hypothetical protein
MMWFDMSPMSILAAMKREVRDDDRICALDLGVHRVSLFTMDVAEFHYDEEPPSMVTFFHDHFRAAYAAFSEGRREIVLLPVETRHESETNIWSNLVRWFVPEDPDMHPHGTLLEADVMGLFTINIVEIGECDGDSAMNYECGKLHGWCNIIADKELTCLSSW